MRTKKEVLADYSGYKALINAVVSNIGMDSIQDVNNHGIGGGFNGFIYYSDTVKFAYKHRKAIISLLENDSEQFGEDVITMISNFGVFRKSKMDSKDRKDLYKYLGGGRCEQSTITNLMAWYAAETVCRWFEN